MCERCPLHIRMPAQFNRSSTFLLNADRPGGESHGGRAGSQRRQPELFCSLANAARADQAGALAAAVPQRAIAAENRPASTRRNAEAGESSRLAAHPGAVLGIFRRLGFWLPVARLHLAVSRRPAGARRLRAALDRQRVVRHVAGDDRARTDIGAAADFHRRHQRRV